MIISYHGCRTLWDFQVMFGRVKQRSGGVMRFLNWQLVMGGLPTPALAELPGLTWLLIGGKNSLAMNFRRVNCGWLCYHCIGRHIFGRPGSWSARYRHGISYKKNQKSAVIMYGYHRCRLVCGAIHDRAAGCFARRVAVLLGARTTRVMACGDGTGLLHH